MNKKSVIIAVLGLIFIAVIILLFVNFRRPAAAQITLYYGDGCPHCQNVEKYLTDNKVADQIKFDRKEVFKDQNNAKEMEERAVSCGLTTDQGIGVPFLYDGKNCYVGDTDVINFFNSRIK